MSLVICSNQDADGASERQSSSIFEPWSFRNALSSTYNIPANSQVALQSCKVNIDGRVTVSGANNHLYQYFGVPLDVDGISTPQQSQSTSQAVLVDILGGNEEVIKELAVEDYAVALQKAMRRATFHPNQKGGTDVTALTNASGLDFLGYQIVQKQQLTSTSYIAPSVGAALPGDREVFQYWNDGADEPTGAVGGDRTFAYSAGVMTRNDANLAPAAAIFTRYPLSTNGGTLVVNLSGTATRVAQEGKAWKVGLSRFVDSTNNQDFFYPNYSSKSLGANLNTEEDVFMDFGICKNKADELVVFHQVYDNDLDVLVQEEVKYWNNASSFHSGEGSRANLSGIVYTDVRFTVSGERVKVELNTDKGYLVVTDYKSGGGKDTQYKPVNQACWCLHPVLMMDSDSAGGTNTTMEITTFDAMTTITDYDPIAEFLGGWYETMSILGTEAKCEALESRPILTTAGPAYEQQGIFGAAPGPAGGVTYNNIIVPQESRIYTGTAGANSMEVLGFRSGIVTGTVASNTVTTFVSEYAPSLTSSLSLFCRLGNFGQKVVNARVGNKSQILSHLAGLESEVGRQTYEPSNLVWIDLNNAADLNITEFDISFCYVNEQFARILTGQAIVALYFRKKGDML